MSFQTVFWLNNNQMNLHKYSKSIMKKLGLAGVFTVLILTLNQSAAARCQFNSSQLFDIKPVRYLDLKFGLANVEGIKLYEHGNFEGRVMPVHTALEWIGSDFNDIVSSVTVSMGGRVTLYENANFEGRSKSFSEDTAWVGDDFNDIASSVRVESTVIYEHEGLTGREITVTGDMPWVGVDFNDIVSSVYVPDGYILTLYENGNYEGRSKVFTGGQGGVNVGGDFNDIASSAKLERIR